MLVTCVHVEVKQEFLNDFINECVMNHQNSVLEEGNLRFDILQDSSNPCKFMLYEAYQNEEFSAAHKTTAHYLQWKNNVEKMMACPRKGIKYEIISPREISQW